MKTHILKHILVAAGLLTSAFTVQADDITWPTLVLADSFELNGTTRTAGGTLYGKPEQGDGTWLNGNSTTRFNNGGGIVGWNTTNGAGYGSAYSRVSFGSFDFSQQTTGYLKLTASVTLGQMSEWMGFGFLTGNGSDWWGGGSVNQLWFRINAAGMITLQGNVNNAVSLSIAGREGFTASGPLEISILYNVETHGVDLYFGDEILTKNWNLKTNSALTVGAAGFYLNGSTGPNAQGAISEIHSIAVYSTEPQIPEPSTVAAIGAGAALLAAVYLRRNGRRG